MTILFCAFAPASYAFIYVWKDMKNYNTFTSTIEIVLISGIVALLVGLIGLLVGILLAYSLGYIFPKELKERSYKINHLHRSGRTDTHYNSVPAGKTTILVPYNVYTPIIRYTYLDGDGNAQTGSVTDNNSVTIIEEERLDSRLVIYDWPFKEEWMNLFAQTDKRTYKFHIPKGMSI